MLVSNFDRIFDNIPKTSNISWENFVRLYDKHIKAAAKTAVPAISPAEWAVNAYRKKSDVLRIHFAAIDLDRVPEETVEQIREIIEPYSFLAYTTWSHAKAFAESGSWHLRIFLPFSRPVEINEWKEFWPKLNAFFGGHLDSACKDPGRIYLIPSSPLGSVGNIVLDQDKKPLNVDEILRDAKYEGKVETVARSSLQAFARSLSSRVSAHHQSLGEALHKVLKGQPFAEPGLRDQTLFKLTGALALQWPNGDPKALGACFEASLKKMQEHHAEAPTMEQVVEKITRHQDNLRQEQKALRTDQQNVLRQRIRNAFAGERDAPYTEEEINQFAADANISRSDFGKRWIIQYGPSYFVFKDGDYQRPVGFNELSNTLFTDLAPASSVGVDCFKPTKRGSPVFKSERELMQEYGTTAKHAVASLSAQKSRYNWKTQTFEEAVSPLRKLEPQFSEAVDQYFRALGDANAERLLDWIAVITKLNEPCAALFLHGVSGAGKTLLAMGLARLWVTEEPTDIKEAFGNFNESLTRCPLILADEHLSGFVKKEGSTADLRSFIQARQRTLSRKFKVSVSLEGAIRLIITANNRNLFNTKEALTNEDIEAIKDRILYIYASQKSRDFLNALSLETKDSFVQGDEMARHALWLRDNRQVQRDGRFLVSGCDSAFHHALTTGTGIRAAVCHWLTSYLQDSKKMDLVSGKLIRIEDGQLHVTARALASFWNMYETNIKPPSSTIISGALSGLSVGKIQLKDAKRVPTNYWIVRTEYLLSWNSENEYATKEEILGALGKNNLEVAAC